MNEESVITAQEPRRQPALAPRCGSQDPEHPMTPGDDGATATTRHSLRWNPPCFLQTRRASSTPSVSIMPGMSASLF